MLLILVLMPLDFEGGPRGPGTQMPGANVSEEGTKRLFGIISKVKNSVILFEMASQNRKYLSNF